uniref:Uncharacterized protein n=1 Tax=Arundo donax TaxID=35708 RepID=A0A0A9BLS2_ARUDO
MTTFSTVSMGLITVIIRTKKHLWRISLNGALRSRMFLTKRYRLELGTFEGSCSDDNSLHTEVWTEKYSYNERIDFLGFHFHKEVVFLYESHAYDLNCSKLQDMGRLSLHYHIKHVEMTIPYTPCWICRRVP